MTVVRGKLWSAAMAAAGLLVLAGAGLAMTAAEEEEAWKKEPAYGKTIRIGYSGALCTGTFGIAQVKGFYAAEGLDTEILMTDGSRGGGAIGVDALGTGKADVTGGHIATMLVPTVNGVRVKFTTGIHSACKDLYVLTDSPFQSTKDLEGHTIAIPSGIGTSDHNITLRFLLRDGVDIPAVKWKVTDSGAAVLAMQNGEIQAALLSDQFAKVFVDAGTLRMVRSLSDDDFKSEACCIHAVNLDFYEKNPITVKKLTRAHEAASAWMMEHPAETVRTLQENSWASGDFDYAYEMIQNYDFLVSDEATEETLKKVVEDYKVLGLIDKNKDSGAVMAQIWDPVLMEK